MEGAKFRNKRIKIEMLYDRVNSCIKNKQIKKAEKDMQKARNLLSELSLHVTGNEIQERSIGNMEIKSNYLLKRIDQLTG